jgi:hypothetical protein
MVHRRGPAMNRHRTLATGVRLCVIVSALMLLSCAETTRPLSDPHKAKADSRLVGVWRLIPNDKAELEYMFLFIGDSDDPAALPGMMKALEVSSGNNGRLGTPEPFYFCITRLAGQKYANALHARAADALQLLKSDPENAKPWSVLKYAVDQDRLTVWVMDDKAASTAVRKSQVEGRFGKALVPTVSMTGGDNLARFLSDGGDKILFNDKRKLEFARVR